MLSGFLNYFIFNSTFGKDEGQEKLRILYYYPHGMPLDVKIRHVGLSEGIIKFASTFTGEYVTAVHSQKRRLLLYQPETNYYLAMTFDVPQQAMICTKLKGFECFDEEHGDDLSKSFLEKSYYMFRMFNGTFMKLFQQNGKFHLIRCIENFFNWFLSQQLWNCVTLIEAFGGIEYLPLDRTTYCSIQYFISTLKSYLENVDLVMLVLNDRQIWSDLELEDSRILYCFLQNYFSSTSSDTSSKKKFPLQDLDPFGNNRKDGLQLYPPLKLHLNTAERYSSTHYMLICHFSVGMLCILLDENESTTDQYIHQVKRYCSDYFVPLLKELHHQFLRHSSLPLELHHQYIYLNTVNFAVKLTLTSESKKMTYNSDSAWKAIYCLYSDFIRCQENESGEIILKITNSEWVIAKCCDGRQIYIAFTLKTSNLIYVNDEGRKLCLNNFSNIFLLD